MALTIDAREDVGSLLSTNQSNLVLPAIPKVILVLRGFALVIGVVQNLEETNSITFLLRRLTVEAHSIMHSIYTQWLVFHYSQEMLHVIGAIRIRHALN